MNTIKKIYNLSIIIGVIALSSACSKNLENLVPEGTPTSDNLWKTSSGLSAAVNGLYENFGEENMYGRGYFWFINASDDMVTGRIKAAADNIKNFTCTGNEDYLTAPWKLHYQTMKRANDVIINGPTVATTDDVKNFSLGQAYFIHAVMHLEIAYNFGSKNQGVPIQNRNDMPAFPAQAKSVDDNYDYIIADLLKAVDLLPYFDKLSAADYGRAHKTAAWAYLAKTYLYKKDYINAEKYAEMVINSGKHTLLNNYTDVFKIANNWSKEYIWSVNSGVNGGSKLPGVMLENKGWGKYNGWGYYMPTKELVDSYENGDKRKAASILQPGDHFLYFGEDKIYSSTNSLSGYQFNKYMEPYGIGTSAINPSGDSPTTKLNVPLLRYAEVVLFATEAKLMQGKNGDAEINQIRNRAGLASITNATMTDLKKERRSELAGEWSDRHFDLVRWGDAQATYALPLHGADGKVIWAARTFNPSKNNVWPIPPNEIVLSYGLLKQNPGW